MAKSTRKKRTKPGVPGEAGVAVNPFTADGNGKGNGGPPDLSEDERRALFSSHLRKYQSAKAELDAANGRFRSVCKLARTECGQDAVKRFRVAVDLGTPEGERRVQERIASELEVARWLGSPVGTQFTLSLDVDRTPAVERAYEDGKRAGLAGEPRRPPHAPGTQQEQEWLRGFGVGNATLAKGIRKTKPNNEGDEARGPAGSL